MELVTKGSKRPKIVLAHSSPEVLEHDERLKLREILEQNDVVLYLCGHKHGIRFDTVNDIRYVVIGCNKYAAGVTPGFAIGDWDENSNKIAITTYNWEKNSWAEYTHFNKDSPILDIPLSEDYKRTTNALIDNVNSTTCNISSVPIEASQVSTVNPYKEALKNGLFS